MPSDKMTVADRERMEILTMGHWWYKSVVTLRDPNWNAIADELENIAQAAISERNDAGEADEALRLAKLARDKNKELEL